MIFLRRVGFWKEGGFFGGGVGRGAGDSLKFTMKNESESFVCEIR